MESTLKRLEELSALKDGWYDGRGITPSEFSYNKARKLIEELSKLNTNLYVYPLFDGGISIEFSGVHLNFDIEINNNEDMIYLYCFSRHGHSSCELEYSYDKLQTVFDMNNEQLQKYYASYPS